LRGVLTFWTSRPSASSRDNLRLLETLTALRQKGNSLVIVEHDEETMRRADHIIDLGRARAFTAEKSWCRERWRISRSTVAPRPAAA